MNIEDYTEVIYDGDSDNSGSGQAISSHTRCRPGMLLVCRPVIALEPPIHASVSAAFRNIAGGVNESAFLTTLGTRIRGNIGGNQKSAFVAFPVCQTALGADISLESAVRGLTAVSANSFFSFSGHGIVLHLI